MSLKKYKTIVIDPPWKQEMTGSYNKRENRAKGLDYNTMSIDEIGSMPIGNIADEGAHLWIWTTNQFLRDGFDLMEGWGFKYLAPIHTIKPSGIGNYFLHRTETLLFGYYKKCIFGDDRYIPNIIEVPRPKRHSEKPQVAYDYIERISAPSRIDIFARKKRVGWDVWGDEVESDIDMTSYRSSYVLD